MGMGGPEGENGAGSSAGRRRILLGSCCCCCCWSRREQKNVCPERLGALTLAFLPDGVGDAGGAVARQEGPQAVLSRGLRQPVGRGGHVGQEGPGHRGRGWRPREPSQGRGPEQAGLQQREGVRGRRHQRQRLQRAGQRRGQRRRGSVRARRRRFFLRGPQSARQLGQPLGRLGRGLLLRGRGSGRQDGLVGLGGRRGAAGAVGADVQVLEEGAVRAEAQQAVLTPERSGKSRQRGDAAPAPPPARPAATGARGGCQLSPEGTGWGQGAAGLT